MARKQQNPKQNRKIIASLFAALILLGAAGLVYSILKKSDNSSVNNDTPTNQPGTNDGINYSPPTQEEVDEADSSKIDKIEGAENTPGSAQNENPVRIQSAYYDEASGQIIIQTELYGTNWTNCTVTISNGSSSVTRESPTVYGQPFSSCEGFAVSDPDLYYGQWQIELEARDTNNNVKRSEPVTVDISS